MNWLVYGVGTIQPEEVIWLLIVGYALISVHVPARKEAYKDMVDAERNNHQLSALMRKAAYTIARGRYYGEGFFVTGWVFNGLAGVRSLFLPFNPNVPRVSSMIAVSLIISGALMFVLASRAWTKARSEVRAMRSETDL